MVWSRWEMDVGWPSSTPRHMLDGFPARAVAFFEHHEELRAGTVDDLVEAFAGGRMSRTRH